MINQHLIGQDDDRPGARQYPSHHPDEDRCPRMGVPCSLVNGCKMTITAETQGLCAAQLEGSGADAPAREERYIGIEDDLRLCKRWLRIAITACENSVNPDTITEWRRLATSGHHKFTENHCRKV